MKRLPRFSLSALALLATAIGASATETPLRTVKAIRDLPVEEAEADLPVELQGVVTYYEPGHSFFLQDATGGIFVNYHNRKVVLVPGDRVQVVGGTHPGMFVNKVMRTPQHNLSVKVVGKNALPKPPLVSGVELAQPHQDCHWVMVEAQVREVFVSDNLVTLQCYADPCEFFAILRGPADSETIPWHLAERRVRIRGVAGTTYNAQRQMTRRLLRVSSTDDIEVLDRLPASSGSPRPARSLELLRADGPGPTELVSIRGIVTLARPGRGVFLRTEDGSLWVQTAQPANVSLGDVVQVEGWPRPGPMKPFLSARKIVPEESATSVPSPIQVTPKAACEASYEAELVSMDAELLDVLREPEGYTLELRDSDIVFRGHLAGDDLALPRLESGTRLRLTGIAQITSSRRYLPLQEADRLLIQLRSPEDIKVLALPTRWTPRNITLGFAVFLVAGIAVLIRSRVRRARERATQQREFEAVLAERSRFAREIHDSLAQGLTSISLQLECIREDLHGNSLKAAKHIELARTIVRDSLREARRTIWNLRPLALGEADLIHSLDRLGSNLTRDTNIAFNHEIQGIPRPLPPDHEAALLRIGQEAMTNAIRHARPSKLSLSIHFDPRWITLCIRDTGRGFDVAHVLGKGRQGFGLLGMKERILALGGSLTIDSSPGEGTEVSAALPLPA